MIDWETSAEREEWERSQAERNEPCDLCGEPAKVIPFVAQNPDAAHVCPDCSGEDGEAAYELRQGEAPDDE
jgi:hypothetical protein